MPGAFRTPVDIANRALQLLRRPAIFSFDDQTVEGRETRACYDQLRLAELRRAVWRFSTRRVILRAITATAQFLFPPDWNILTPYASGDVVSYANQVWAAKTPNTAQQPGDVPPSGILIWESYFGPLVVDVWQPTSYFAGELVYKTPADGTYTVYRSLFSNNENDPEAVDPYDPGAVYQTDQVVSFSGVNYQSLIDLNFKNQPDTSPDQWSTTVLGPAWDAAVSYGIGDVVAFSGVNYQSLIDPNLDHEPDISPSQWTVTVTRFPFSNSWRATPATLTNLNINYPLGAGPATDHRTRNAYRLPAAFMRQAPSDPKADINPFLGAPTGNIMPDWIFESDYIVSANADPIMLRFVADVQNVPEFDALFAIGLSTRMALELAPRLVDGEHLVTILGDAREEYGRTITEARTVNGIETGPVSAYEDDYITARL